MKKLYRVHFVGNDSIEYRKTVWATGHRDAKAEVKKHLGADEILSVRRVSFFWWWVLLVGLVAVCSLAALAEVGCGLK